MKLKKKLLIDEFNQQNNVLEQSCHIHTTTKIQNNVPEQVCTFKLML